MTGSKTTSKTNSAAITSAPYKWGVWVLGSRGPEFQLLTEEMRKPTIEDEQTRFAGMHLLKVVDVDMSRYDENTTLDQIAEDYPLTVHFAVPRQ